jgi:hypothetical protein
VADTNAITVWLAVIGVASVLQVALLIGAVVAGVVAYRRASNALDLLRQQTLDPLVQRVNTVLEDVHDVAGRVQTADDQVRGAVSRTAGRVGLATSLVGARFWPILGVARGIWAAVESLRGRSGGRPTPPPASRGPYGRPERSRWSA